MRTWEILRYAFPAAAVVVHSLPNLESQQKNQGSIIARGEPVLSNSDTFPGSIWKAYIDNVNTVDNGGPGTAGDSIFSGGEALWLDIYAKAYSDRLNHDIWSWGGQSRAANGQEFRWTYGVPVNKGFYDGVSVLAGVGHDQMAEIFRRSLRLLQQSGRGKMPFHLRNANAANFYVGWFNIWTKS